MKRFLFGFLAVFFLILNTIPYLHIMADDMPTNSQYEMLGAYALSTLITSGEATELDFSDYTENDTSFLIDLGEAIFTGDWSGLAEDGLEWLGETADNIYDSYKEYVSQWKSDHLGIMYSNWFPDETIYVGPDDSYSLAKPLRELFTSRNNTPAPTPDPDVNYYQYIRIINENNNTGRDFFWNNFHNASNYSFSVQESSLGQRNIVNGDYSTYYMQASLPCTIYITGSGSSWFWTVSGWSTVNYFLNNNNVSYPVGQVYSPVGSQGALAFKNTLNNYNPAYNFLSGGPYNSLSSLFSVLTLTYRNMNIYVNGYLWASPFIDEPTYPIVIPGQLIIYNNQPLEYSFPSNTHIKLPDLTNIIRNAINSSGLVMWSDIADVFVDVNGQTAVAVTKIVRNDYDNLYMEQYPYPAMLVGMTDQTKFNEHLLDNSHAYLSPINTVVQETVGVLPSELVGVLAIGAILTIFAVIINRLLE